MRRQRADVAIVGAGILGLAHAWSAAAKGRSVVLFERSQNADGASVRNFGLVWPVGQSAGANHDLALRSREMWMSVLDQARLPYCASGSLHLAYREDEAEVSREFAAIGPKLGFDCRWLTSEEATARSQTVQSRHLLGALWSPTELNLDSRKVVDRLPIFMAEQKGVQLRFSTTVRSIDLPWIDTAEERWEVSAAIVCSGDDLQTLYPQLLGSSGLIRSKLQMMRTVHQPLGWSLGPALAAGLTLRSYPAFAVCSSLDRLKKRFAEETPEYDRWGIHVLVAETTERDLTIGDSHEYGCLADSGHNPEIDRLILDYAGTFLRVPTLEIARRWVGMYVKHPVLPFASMDAAPGVRIVTGAGGAGMTLAFGIAERTTAGMGL